eukprot:2424833-Rhodomonas_salina.1
MAANAGEQKSGVTGELLKDILGSFVDVQSGKYVGDAYVNVEGGGAHALVGGTVIEDAVRRKAESTPVSRVLEKKYIAYVRDASRASDTDLWQEVITSLLSMERGEEVDNTMYEESYLKDTRPRTEWTFDTILYDAAVTQVGGSPSAVPTILCGGQLLSEVEIVLVLIRWEMLPNYAIQNQQREIYRAMYNHLKVFFPASYKQYSKLRWVLSTSFLGKLAGNPFWDEVDVRVSKMYWDVTTPPTQFVRRLYWSMGSLVLGPSPGKSKADSLSSGRITTLSVVTSLFLCIVGM